MQKSSTNFFFFDSNRVYFSLLSRAWKNDVSLSRIQLATNEFLTLCRPVEVIILQNQIRHNGWQKGGFIPRPTDDKFPFFFFCFHELWKKKSVDKNLQKLRTSGCYEKKKKRKRGSIFRLCYGMILFIYLFIIYSVWF